MARKPNCKSCPWFRSPADCPVCARWTPPPPVTTLDRVSGGVYYVAHAGVALGVALLVVFALLVK